MDMYVSNLDSKVRDEDLRGLFAPFGEVNSALIINSYVTGHSRGYGFVEMKDETAGTRAISELNNVKVFSRNIKVLQAKCKVEEKKGAAIAGKQ